MLPLQFTYAFATLLIMLGNDILIVLDIPTNLPTAPELPAVSPFLCSDDSESDPESEPVDELPERHLSLRLYDDVVSKWRDRVRFCPSSPSGSSSPNTTISSIEIPFAPIPPAPSIEIATAPPACDTLTLVIIASPAVRSYIRTTVRKSTLGLRPVMTPARSAALRTQISPEDYSHHSSEAVRSPSRPLTPLSPARADLLPPHKRYRGTYAAHSYESSDEGSLKTHAESDMDSDIRADIEAETTAAATIAAATIDGLGIKMGFEPGLAVVEFESEPKEAEANDEADVEIQAEGTIEIRVDVTTGIGIPYDLPMPNTIERLDQLKESVQGMYGYRQDRQTSKLGT
ncbi:hypothetical protein Tco_0750997 [Tanacetum coccineum]|uniref:Uncharacterized protein n=1 Tax=Tanacetum coccineum TaxID=301880 RepID=A0ABQ4Z3Y5_9ASTR